MNLLEVKCPGPETSSGPLEVHRTALARDKAAPSTGRTADGMLRPVVRITRRRLLVGAAAGVAAGAGYAFGLEPRWLEVREWLVPVVGLPRSLAGYRIAQVTDAHLASLGLVEEAIVRAVRALDVQLVALTGDMIDSEAHVPVLRAFCSELAQEGRSLVATLGNWEHWGGLSALDLAATYRSVGAELLVNDSLLVDGALRVVGADDSTGGKPRLDEALCQREQGAAALFLTHSPALLDRLSPAAGAFDLALAGHTHGGQVRVGSYLPALPPGSGRFVAGWYDIPTGRAYVSRGTGLSVLPVRFGARPELPVFTLVQG